MTWRVEVSPAARVDLGELIAFLEARSPAASDKARQALRAALLSLGEFPQRGRKIEPESIDLRELPVRFGRYGYAIRYRIMPELVFVTGVRHARQVQRSATASRS